MNAVMGFYEHFHDHGFMRMLSDMHFNATVSKSVTEFKVVSVFSNVACEHLQKL